MEPVLVTGTSSGIGRAITESLSEAGSPVYATVRRRKDFDSLRALPKVSPIIMDVTKPDQIRRGVAQIRRAGRGLYGVVNNAAIIDCWPMVELKEEELRLSFEVNVLGAQRVVLETVPLLAESHGRIVNISSLEGFVTTKFAGPYEMSKFALEAYSDDPRRELQDYGVSVVVVEPGGFKSDYAKTAAKLLARRARARRPILMKKEVAEMAKIWRDELSDVERRASPSLVADAVREALFSEKPKNRYVVTATEAEFHWAMDELMSKLIEVNRGSDYALSKEDVHALLDRMWAGSQSLATS
jgi:NAD(P)-dependent dehydrogenase (short-subunit alcohol dehydrogenase family)